MKIPESVVPVLEKIAEGQENINHHIDTALQNIEEKYPTVYAVLARCSRAIGTIIMRK